MRIILFSLFLVLVFAFKHPFYMSVTELRYNQEESALQGTIKLFSNDLEDALLKLTGKRTDLINSRDTVEIVKIFQKYLDKRMLVSVNEKPLKVTVLGFEKEQEAVWLYIELPKCPLPKTVDVETSILYDFIKEQINILRIEVKGKEKSAKVINPERKVSLNF